MNKKYNNDFLNIKLKCLNVQKKHFTKVYAVDVLLMSLYKCSLNTTQSSMNQVHVIGLDGFGYLLALNVLLLFKFQAEIIFLLYLPKPIKNLTEPILILITLAN